VTGPADDPDARVLRDAIDAADREILTALNARITAVQRLHDLKRERGYSLSDPAREAGIIAGLRSANTGPLDDAAVPALVAAILRLTRDEVARLRGESW
jgi:chorismate mutase / prephenate dehydratase